MKMKNILITAIAAVTLAVPATMSVSGTTAKAYTVSATSVNAGSHYKYRKALYSFNIRKGGTKYHITKGKEYKVSVKNGTNAFNYGIKSGGHVITFQGQNVFFK